MSGDKQLEERRKYVTAFNSTMVKIWREQINLLGVIDTGALYRSTMAVRMTADGKFILGNQFLKELGCVPVTF